MNGRKAWITSALIADVFVCLASTDPSEGRAGDHGVPGGARHARIQGSAGRSRPWVCARPPWAIWCSRIASSLPTRCSAARAGGQASSTRPSSGSEGRSWRVFWARCAAQLEACIAHARRRKQFGQPIAKFQSVSNRIVEMKLRLETSRFMVYRYAWATSHGEDAAVWSSMAKLHVSECFAQNSLDALRLFGASGFAAGPRRSETCATVPAA